VLPYVPGRSLPDRSLLQCTGEGSVVQPKIEILVTMPERTLPETGGAMSGITKIGLLLRKGNSQLDSIPTLRCDLAWACSLEMDFILKPASGVILARRVN
jgi:hypothetical protein